MKLQLTARFQNKVWRLDDATGFLRCTATILCVGVLEYLPEELPEFPRPAQGPIRLMVDYPALADPLAITSLEGMPVVVGHVWQDVTTVGSSCGNIAGAPVCNETHLTADILVTDKEAIRRILLPDGDPQQLQEVSSAYDSVILIEPGIDPATGREYHGKFSNIRYNHSAILPPGMGRAGPTVRIINQQKAQKMDVIKVKLNNGAYVRVVNEDVPALEADQKKDSGKIDATDLDAKIAELTDLKKQQADLQAKIDELTGSLAAVQEQLAAATADDTVEAAAETMNAERDEADKVMNSHGLKLAPEVRKLRGHALRLAVVNSIRTAQQKDALAADSSEGFVQGFYGALREAPGAKAVPVVPGAQIVNSQIQNGTAHDTSNTGRAAVLYPHLVKGAQK